MSIRRNAVGVMAIVAAALTAVVPVASGDPLRDATAAEAASPAAEATTAPQWRLDDVPVQGRANLVGVTAVNRDDAWAVGFTVTGKAAPAEATKPSAVTGRTRAVLQTDHCDDHGLPSLALHWDGAGWSQAPVPDLGRLTSVSASGPANVWATGDCGVLHWDGRTWAPTSPVAIPGTDGSSFTGIKAVGADDVWLSGSAWDGTTGNTHGFVQHWDGSRWRLVPLPPLGDEYDIGGLDARGSQDVWVAGTDSTGYETHAERLLLLHWNGHGWKRFAEPANTMWRKHVVRVRAVAGDDVWLAVVGQRVPDGNDIRRPLVLHWNGAAWADTHAPEERGDLFDIAADGRTVLAAGDTWSPLDTEYEAYARRWTGDGWTPAPLPVPGRASITALSPIPGGGMWAVGATGDEDTMRPFIARSGY
ncbi:hypothetical protein [Actinoallomurus soli]|uniref:hypothetical protein n=1 Tax=Actinoallomurus soli TaxID=2952535 RepID=UPI002093F3A7|nr:hypothetical protein [Actinoallomurus soli]MCO5971994.1 hypothetical protein [Actinoallomurus soli]